MEPEKKEQDVNDEQIDPKVDDNPTDDNDNGQGNDDVDEKGVEWKNRAAEAQRKLDEREQEIEDMNLRMQALEAKLSNPNAPAQPAQPANPNQATKKSGMDEMIALGPEAYNKKIAAQVLAEEKRKQANAEAEQLIIDKYGVSRARYGLQKIVKYARENMIDLNANPKKAVAMIIDKLDSPKKKPLSNEDKKKAEAAIKNKPESGKRTPPPPTPKDTSIQDNLKRRGSMDDAVAWLQERFKEPSE